MRINFLVNPVTGGWEPTDARLGGTEESVVQWAEELARQGHTVTVFRNPGGEDLPMWGDVYYARREEYPNKRGQGVTVNVKSSDIKPIEPTIYFTNETNASDLDLSAYNAVVWPSQWAKDNIPVNNPNVHVVPHGYDPTRIYPGMKIPKQCLYASSPDRGLDVLLEAWPKVYEQHPDATLIVTYGGTGPVLPGVTYMGDLDETTMDELYCTSDVWCHPCTGVELFCISGLKAQAAGCMPVVIPAMALKETCKFGVMADSPDTYAEMLTEALKPGFTRDIVRVNSPPVSNHDYPTWQTSTDALLRVIESVL